MDPIFLLGVAVAAGIGLFVSRDKKTPPRRPTSAAPAALENNADPRQHAALGRDAKLKEIPMQRPVGAYLAEEHCFANLQRTFDATVFRLLLAGGPRTAGLEMPIALVPEASRWSGT